MRDWPPCDVCGEREGLPHHGNANLEPTRANFQIEGGKQLLVCRRCYFRLNRRRKNGQDPLGGIIQPTERVRQVIAKQRQTKGCPLCQFVPGDVPGDACRLPKCSLSKLGFSDIFVCAACYKWAQEHPDMVQTMTLDELRLRRKKMAQEYYRGRGESKWKTFWCKKKEPRVSPPKAPK